MFGKTMRIERNNKRKKKGFGVTLKSVTKAEVVALCEPLSKMAIALTTLQLFAFTVEKEEKWWEHMSEDEDVHWGIYSDKIKLSNGKTLPSKLVGFTSLHLKDLASRTWRSGIIIAYPEYHGLGIASLAHIGRTGMAALMPLHRKSAGPARFIESDVIAGNAENCYEGDFEKWKETKNDILYGNWPSRMALERVGYAHIGTKPAVDFRTEWKGRWDLLWINPNEERAIFPNGTPSKYHDSLENARIALENFKSMVTF